VDTFRARIQVERVWKGETRGEITMLTGVEDLGNGMMRSNSCNYSYRAGQRYVVYAGGAPGQLLSQPCSRTKVATAEEIDGLDQVARPKKVADEVRSCSGPLSNSGAGEIRITISNPASQALPAVTLTAESSGRKYGAMTDKSGKSIFSGVQPGDYKITANIDGYLARQSTVTVPATSCVEASLYLIPAGSQ
jgi:hypothetical protein